MESNSNRDLLPDYAQLHSSGISSDMTVIVKEELPAVLPDVSGEQSTSPQAKRCRVDPPKVSVPAHKVVLWGMGKFFQAKLQNWGEKPEVELVVPPGQLAIGEALIKAMYNRGADLPKLSQQQQLQLLQLSDVYDVIPISTAICNSLYNLHRRSIKWDTAIAIFTLPDSCKQLSSYSKLQRAAADKLQQVLGDHELVWKDCTEGGQQGLLQLPFPALECLLADPRTKVASEDTIFFTMDRWLAQNPATTEEQKKELVKLLRLHHCTPSYLVTVMAVRNSWLLKYVDASELCSAAAASAAGVKSPWGLDFFHHLTRRVQKARPASVAVSLTIPLKVPVQRLQQMFGEAIDGNAACYQSSWVRWQGRQVRLEFAMEYNSEEEGVVMSGGVEWKRETTNIPAGLPNMMASGRMWLKGFLMVEGSERDTLYSKHFSFDDHAAVSMGSISCRVASELGLGKLPPQWAAALAMLEVGEYLQGDNCMHLKLGITGFR